MNVIVVYQMNSYVLAKLAASLQHHAHEGVQHCCLHHHALTFRCNTIWLQYWCALQQTFINFVVELLQQIHTGTVKRRTLRSATNPLFLSNFNAFQMFIESSGLGMKANLNNQPK